MTSVLGLLKRPGFWTAVVAVVAYWDAAALRGSFVYDDAGSVKKNVVVNGVVPWTEVVKRDFWGTSLDEISSHKSFRPITTLSFRLNWILAERMGMMGTDDETMGYHLVNVGLHGIVTWLVTEASAFLFDGTTLADLIAQLITGLLFGLHPVHVEAVSNITSRGELLMSLFFLLAFLSYASHIPTRRYQRPISPGRLRYGVSVYVLPFLFMTCSLFSKEQGATTLISLVAFDFLNNMGSVHEFANALLRKERGALHFLRRTIILAVQTLTVCGLRIWLNGETSPDFVYEQNPAGFSEDRLTRLFSVTWVYCLYIFDAVYPKYLCCDWSGNSIPLIERISDVRILGPICLWLITAWCCRSLLLSQENATSTQKESRRVVLMAFFAFLFSPFLLSSNLLVVIGLMKADRVIYLPLFGFCLMEALVFKLLFCNRSQKDHKEKWNILSGSGVHWLGHLLIMVQFLLFAQNVHERSLAWSSNLALWTSAYEVNPTSHHTIYNCGYELSLKKYYYKAEQVLRPIGSAHVAGPSNTFVYAMTLYNLQRREEARKYIDEALAVVDEKKKEEGPRAGTLVRTESNLLVAKALCTDDISEMGRLMYSAVEVDPQNEYAIQQAQQMMDQIKTVKKYQEQGLMV